MSRGGWRVKPFVRTIWSNAASLYMCVLWHEYVQAERGKAVNRFGFGLFSLYQLVAPS